MELGTRLTALPKAKGQATVITTELCEIALASPVPAVEILNRLGEAISATQSALLCGRLSEFESSLAEQRELCGQLQPLIATVKDTSTSPSDYALLHAANTALDRGRVLAAVLRRMRLTLAAMQAAMQATPLVYSPPAAPGVAGSR